jgi:cytosine/adenosine deaminase-related metal-dependent hydrolase
LGFFWGYRLSGRILAAVDLRSSLWRDGIGSIEVGEKADLVVLKDLAG